MVTNMDPTLFVGFDSAWSAANRGAIVAAVRDSAGRWAVLFTPQAASFAEATEKIAAVSSQVQVSNTVVFIDQPTIVPNAHGQRPVENLVASAVSRRRGGVQPAYRGRAELFGDKAPIWEFLEHHGGVADLPLAGGSSAVVETYPALTLVALGWTTAGPDGKQRLPKYNPLRRATFAGEDWEFVKSRVATEYANRDMHQIAAWIRDQAPKKAAQDGLDACICLLVAMLGTERDLMTIGQLASGYIVVPYSAELYKEICERCELKDFVPAQWVQSGRAEF